VLFGGTAPVEQISGSTAVFLVTSPTGVQGVYGATGTSLEQALYSPYGTPTVTSGAIVTPFGFQGSYTDATGLIYLINRYYDPTTDQFLSIDPAVAQTDQPYVFVNDDPLIFADPLGLCSTWNFWCVFQHSRAGGDAIGASLIFLGSSIDAFSGGLLIASGGASLEVSAPLAYLSATITTSGIVAIVAANSSTKMSSKTKPISPPSTKKRSDSRDQDASHFHRTL
jgi:RHS repeat-associated protein